ncbi:hypothetical protein D3C81_2098940 [compost metagenome]
MLEESLPLNVQNFALTIGDDVEVERLVGDHRSQCTDHAGFDPRQDVLIACGVMTADAQ